MLERIVWLAGKTCGSNGLNCSLSTGEVVEVSRRQALRFKELMSL